MDDQPARATTEQHPVRLSSVRDYLRVLRRYRLMIVLITLLVGGASFGFSLSQEKTYEASASISFRDPFADAELLGRDLTAEEAPQTRAAINAELIESPPVVERARRDLKTQLSAAELVSAVSATVSVETNLVVITARAAEPKLAANIANAFAEAAKRIGDREIRDRLADAETVLEERVEEARDDLEGGGVTEFQLISLTDQLSTVQTLRGIVEPVEISRLASPAASPVSPRPARTTVLGLFAGLILGLGAAFTRDALDRRFRTAHEVHQELGFAVLSRVPESAMGYPGLAVHREKGEVMKEADFEAFRVLRTNLAYLTGGSVLRSILVTSGMPEEGKSTVSMGLASAAASAGQRVLLVECDFRKPTFARRLGVEPDVGLADYLRGTAGPRDVVSTVELRPPAEPNGRRRQSVEAARLACVPAGSNAADTVELFDSERFRDFLGTVGRAYDLVVVDSSPLLAVVDPLRVAPHVDAVLLCVRVMSSTRDQARAVRSALENLPDRPTGAVVTGLSRGGPDSYEYYYGY